MRTGWFPTPFGVKQGDVLSPTLFALFVNDLAQEIKSANLGIDIDGFNLSILLYADDIVVCTDEEIKLQRMLGIMKDWCNKWRLSINGDKTQIVHFRKPSVTRSEFEFFFGQTQLMYSRTYKYLGFIFHENMTFSEGRRVLSESAGRLGAVINRLKLCPQIGYATFTRLFDSMVGPILFYAAGVWGFEDAPECNRLQNRAMRCFLGVHRFTTRVAIEGDMGWEPCIVKQRVEIIRLWNRFTRLSEDRLTRKVFEWDKAHNYPWSMDVLEIFSSVKIQYIFTNTLQCNISEVRQFLFNSYKEQWLRQVLNKPKLRSYVHFKNEYFAEPYVKCWLTRSQRSLCAQLRAGVLPLQIEVGRYKGVLEEDRLCGLCDLMVVEDEWHFLFFCAFFVFLSFISRIKSEFV